MPARLPNLAHLMALLEKFLAPLGPGLPGGTMTNAEIERQEKGSLVKGEPATDEAWDAAVAAASPPPPPSPPPTTPPRKRRRGLNGRFAFAFNAPTGAVRRRTRSSSGKSSENHRNTVKRLYQ
ncbi:hypothetical protein ACHAPQ_011671 [Fusarium lateritium]